MHNIQIESIAKELVDAAYQVHKELGPGLLESAYRNCLFFELTSRGLAVASEVLINLSYKNIQIDCAYRADLIIENELLVELKGVENILPIHQAQLITYLKLSDLKLGFIINFNVKFFKDGITRIVNNY